MEEVISFDYDGTLWDENTDSPIEQVNCILNSFKKKGYGIIIITSRSPEYIDEIKRNYPGIPVYTARNKGIKVAELGNVTRHYDNNPGEIIDIALECPWVETVFVDDGTCDCPDCATRRLRINF